MVRQRGTERRGVEHGIGDEGQRSAAQRGLHQRRVQVEDPVAEALAGAGRAVVHLVGVQHVPLAGQAEPLFAPVAERLHAREREPDRVGVVAVRRERLVDQGRRQPFDTPRTAAEGESAGHAAIVTPVRAWTGVRPFCPDGRHGGRTWSERRMSQRRSAFPSSDHPCRTAKGTTRFRPWWRSRTVRALGRPADGGVAAHRAGPPARTPRRRTTRPSLGHAGGSRIRPVVHWSAGRVASHRACSRPIVSSTSATAAGHVSSPASTSEAWMSARSRAASE